MKPTRIIALLLLTAFISSTACAAKTDVDRVNPIHWSDFRPTDKPSEAFIQSKSLLNHALRYNLQWCERELKAEDGRYALPTMEEHGVRPACSVIYAAATAIKTGGFDEQRVGMTREEAMQRVKRLLEAVSRTHKVNRDTGAWWGNDWQSALWASLAGMGGWMMWDDLDLDSRRQLVAMITFEADRYITDEYEVPYWNGQGGDSKAEENAWNSMILNLAAAMMPDHPRAAQWRTAANELMISACARQSDWQSNERIIEGKAVKDWLGGYNAREDGVVINHDLMHPDYMAAISMNFWGLTTHCLAGRRPSQAWDFNAKVVYRAFIEVDWKSPPYVEPGGPIYRDGEAKIYYPQGSDWSYVDFSAYYLMDIYSHLFGWHDGAVQWMNARGQAMLKMQNRHPDRRMFAAGEYDTYPGAEQWAAWCLADAYLPLWLHETGTLREK